MLEQGGHAAFFPDCAKHSLTMYRKEILISVLLFLAAVCATAQSDQGMGHQHQHPQPTPSPSPADSASSQMPGMHHAESPAQPSFIDTILEHSSSGTSVQPGSVPNSMLMFSSGAWMFMFHGEAFLNFEQQSGPRGGDKVFSTNWFMPMAQRSVGPGLFTVRGMFSLEPATVTDRFYPELFQQGETAFARPIVDGQHPHDCLMELAVLYDWKLGDPAMGPAAYAHRASASENPLAPLGHHLQDSTHIASDVLTAGATYKRVR